MGSFFLTLVILFPVPVLMIVQGLSQALTDSRSAAEHECIRCYISYGYGKSIQRYKLQKTHEPLIIQLLSNRICLKAQFVMVAMFFQGFWFGGRLVRTKGYS